MADDRCWASQGTGRLSNGTRKRLSWPNRRRDIREQGQQLLPGAIEAIGRLRERGIRLVLLTNGSSAVQRAKIERFGLAHHFDSICIEGEFGCGKPDERVYRSALQATTSQPNTTWMVGDNLEWDVIAPMRLGLTGIWLDRFACGLPDATPVKPHRHHSLTYRTFVTERLLPEQHASPVVQDSKNVSPASWVSLGAKSLSGQASARAR